MEALLESMAIPATVLEGWKRVIDRSDVEQSALLFELAVGGGLLEGRGRGGLSRGATYPGQGILDVGSR